MATKYPKTLYVQNTIDDDEKDKDYYAWHTAQESLSDDEDEIIIGVYELKKTVKVSRKQSIVVTDMK